MSTRGRRDTWSTMCNVVKNGAGTFQGQGQGQWNQRGKGAGEGPRKPDRAGRTGENFGRDGRWLLGLKQEIVTT